MLEQPIDEASATATDAGSPRRRFSVHVAWTLSARVVMTINSVAAGVIVARWLKAEGVGQLAVINVAVATIVQLGSAGLPSANTYFISSRSSASTSFWRRDRSSALIFWTWQANP